MRVAGCWPAQGTATTKDCIYGLRLGRGLSFQMLYIESSYDIGLANIGNDEFDDTRTGAFMLTAGVNF